MSGTPYLICANSAASGGVVSIVANTAANVPQGDSILIGVLVSAAGVTPQVADSQNNTYTLVLSDTTETAAQLYIFESDGVFPLTSGTDDIAVTYSANTSVQAFIAIGDDNVFGAYTAGMKIAHGSSAAPSSGSSGTLNQPEVHAIAFITDAAAGGVPTWAAPWSSNVLANEEGGTTGRISAAYQDVVSPSALTASGTITSAVWTAAIIPMDVNPPSILTTLSDGVENEAYSQTLSSTGGISPYTYSILSGSLPTGLSLVSGVISGTPTAPGAFTFTIQVADTNSVVATLVQTITILASGASGVSTYTLEGQLLSAQDQDFESSGVGTWAADSNASSLARVTTTSLTGSASMSWIATAAGVTSVHTGFYRVTPNMPYVASGFILPCGQRDTQIGIEWYNGSSLIVQDLGNDNPSGTIEWQPLAYAGTAPSNATQCRVVYLVQEANAGDVTHIDCTFLAPSGAQVLIDWINPAFLAGGNAGTDFMDVTPWVRMDAGITMQSGRQDAVSEIQAGSASFSLQNDTGLFTRYQSGSLIPFLGGDQTLQRRVQINLTDENGAWYTRWDGPISEIDYDFDNTGNTSIALVNVTDILAELNRQDDLECWTKELVLSDNPTLHWTLDDAGNAGGSGVAAESSGNNGPPMRVILTDNSIPTISAIAWQDTSGGVETLADAVMAGEPDGSEYWSAGTDAPNSQLRGLDSTAVGPYTTPLPSVLLTPKLVAGSNANYYVTNTGYQFQAALPSLISPNAVGDDYSFEIWFTLAGAGATTGSFTGGEGGVEADNLGPFTLCSLGNSRTGLTLVLTVALAGSHLTFQTWVYDQPPGFNGSNFSSGSPPAFVGQVATELTSDKVELPHHAVVTIQGDPSAPVVIAYLDGALFSDEFTSTTLATGSTFDTICVGGAYGGKGAYWGNLQLMSIYDYLMSGQQVINHAQMGQYGMWEETTDDCIAQLGVFANIPSFWNNLSGGRNGLTMTEYQDITGSNALTNMQTYEQTELGLLFVNRAGQLNFHTRDWRMGYGAPDLQLPPDTYDASMGMESIDQFQVNEQAVSTQIFQTGASYINVASQDKYGTYATDGVGSPLQLPLISWSRANSQLGLSSFYYWADPYLDDYCAWLANSRSEPWLVPGQLTIDMLTLSEPGTGVGISDLYALDIDNMVTPSGTLPNSFPNIELSTEWFIEGINETYSTSSRQIQFFTSPAEPQRAWKPGDSTYGVLGTNTRIGISAPDTNTPVADGKDVSHDAGGPYWSPTFTTSEALNSQVVFSTGVATGWTAFQGTLTEDNSVLYPGGPEAWSLVGTGTGGLNCSVEQTSGSIAVTPNQVISTGAWIFSPIGDSVQVGVDFQNSGHTYVSTTVGAPVVVPGGVWTYVTGVDITVPASGVSFAYARADSSISNAVIVVQQLKIVPGLNAPADMNNPAQTGNGFVGAVDIRGLTYNMGLALNPPMCVVGAVSKTQTQPSGSNSSPQIFWDNVYVDTAGGMGLVPGWPNWYVCTVPGFYDIDASLVWNGVAGGAQAAQAFIVVAMGGAQWVAQSISNTPLNVDQYVCPIGEQAFINAHSTNVINCPTTRLYLGVGDMVTIAAEQGEGSSLATSASFGGSKMSLLFRGYAQFDDRQQINTSITGGTIGNGGGGGGGGTPTQTSHTKTYKCTATASFYGAAIGYQRKNTNGPVYQGTYSGGSGVTGSEVGFIAMPFNSIQSDISGATIKSITLKCSNEHTWYNSGGDVMLGWSSRGSLGSTARLGSSDHPNVLHSFFNEGQTKTMSLPVSSFGGPLANLGYFLIGNQSTTNLSYYGFWRGGAGSWTLTVTYLK